jgi:anti-anti-sigma factor
MAVELTSSIEGPRLVLSGVVDVREAATLRTAALRALQDARPVHVDLSETTMLDTAAGQVLLALSRAAAARGQSLSIVGARPIVQRTCAGVGLDSSG